MEQDIARKFAEANSPFTLKQVLEDKIISCNFIEWVLLRIDLRLGTFDPQTSGTNAELKFNKKLGRTQSLTQKLSLIGLCKSTETDLIEATASQNRLFHFYTNLFSMLKAARAINDNDPYKICDMSKMDDLHKSCALMDGLTSIPNEMNKIVDKEFELFPRDVTLMIGSVNDQNKCSKVNNNKVLQSLKESEIRVLQILKDELLRIQGQYQHTEETKISQHTIHKLSRISEELTSQLAKFSRIHDVEIEPWIKKDSMKLNERNIAQGLGSQARMVYNKLDKLRKILKDLETIQTVHTSRKDIASCLHDIMKTQASMSDSIQPNEIIVNNRGETGLEAITRLQNIEKMLRDGLLRREKEGNIKL
ncbi:1629_t:CDS:2 [Acaulospora morrowiae]|uniref:1629_t:CDS:1 n=1 Tax=Acaulospora morrowiae TaxID=94023 RepID=A0A9N9B120_9GLOM|nr:1629_t:CDS:2 [Acaulospora morrowiae]